MTQNLPPYFQDFAIRVAEREMGHYVAARALGFRTGDVSVVLTGPMGDRHGTVAVTLPTAAGSIDQIADYLRRHVIVLFAGAVAETLHHPFCDQRHGVPDSGGLRLW